MLRPTAGLSRNTSILCRRNKAPSPIPESCKICGVLNGAAAKDDALAGLRLERATLVAVGDARGALAVEQYAQHVRLQSQTQIGTSKRGTHVAARGRFANTVPGGNL